mgnify:CR=1 FL=1
MSTVCPSSISIIHFNPQILKHIFTLDTFGGFMSVPNDVMNACVSLFSGAGIGDLGIHYGCGIETIVAVEKEEDRADLIRVNYPETEVIQGDIKQKVTEIIDVSNSKLNGKRPLIISISPPCQGMSQNGMGKINSEIKKVFNTQLNLFNKYHSFNLVLTEEDYFDADLINGCSKFCESISMNFQVLDGLDEEEMRLGEIYFTLADVDLAKAIHYADKKGFEVGKDIGLIGYNDSCFKELLAGGISVISSQPNQMGRMAAEMIQENSKENVELDLQFIQRNSL